MDGAHDRVPRPMLNLRAPSQGETWVNWGTFLVPNSRLGQGWGERLHANGDARICRKPACSASRALPSQEHNKYIEFHTLALFIWLFIWSHHHLIWLDLYITDGCCVVLSGVSGGSWAKLIESQAPNEVQFCTNWNLHIQISFHFSLSLSSHLFFARFPTP